MPEDRLSELLDELKEEHEWCDIAGYIDRDFYMLSVREHKLDWLNKGLRAMGGLPLYTMRPPMHSASFGPLRDRIESELLGDVSFADPAIPIISDHDGTLVQSGAARLLEQR